MTHPVARTLIEVARAHGGRRALVAPDGCWTYAELLQRAQHVAAALLDGRCDLQEARVAFLVRPSCAYVAVQWGIWLAGGIAVPLCVTHPAPELAYVLDDAEASTVVADPALAARVAPLASARRVRLTSPDALLAAAPQSLPEVDPARRAMILYTSGTTSTPKGVVSTHAMLAAQIASVVSAWEWSADDWVLNVLPLHHLHGILNLLCCPLWAGATCELHHGLDAEAVWRRIVAADGLTVFMAVPTIYTRLLAAWRRASASERRAMSAGCARLRLMVSGSAALPTALLEEWREVSGHILLERYGMTEIGMALGNPLHGERRPGSVGVPFPGVSVRLAGEDGQRAPDGTAGEIEVRGPTVFREYWRRPEATAGAFTADGWFRTGDVAVSENGRYRILGRASVDIIKTGGFKVSALEIEAALREHPAIADCAVAGIPDDEWGQRVGVAVVLHPSAALDLGSLRAWAKERLAPYKVPSVLRICDDLPRNAMGKPIKADVAALLTALPDA